MTFLPDPSAQGHSEAEGQSPHTHDLGLLLQKPQGQRSPEYFWTRPRWEIPAASRVRSGRARSLCVSGAGPAAPRCGHWALAPPLA